MLKYHPGKPNCKLLFHPLTAREPEQGSGTCFIIVRKPNFWQTPWSPNQLSLEPDRELGRTNLEPDKLNFKGISVIISVVAIRWAGWTAQFQYHFLLKYRMVNDRRIFLARKSFLKQYNGVQPQFSDLLKCTN